MKKLLVIISIIFIPQTTFADDHLLPGFSVECPPAAFQSPGASQSKNKLKFTIYVNIDTGRYEHVTMNDKSEKFLIYKDQRAADGYSHSLIWYTLYGDEKLQEGWVNKYEFIEEAAMGETFTNQISAKINWELFLETSNKIKNLIYHKQIKLKKAILEKNRDKKQELLFTSCRYLDGEKFKLTK